MRRTLAVTFLITLLSAFVLAQNSADSALFQSQRFLGAWEIRKSQTTGKANLTVTITQERDTISGNIRFINPDGTTTEWPISHAEFRGTTVTRSLVFNKDFRGPTLQFQTLDHDSIMYWSLTLTHATRGFLRGDEHELLIEEKVKKSNVVGDKTPLRH